MDPVVEVVEAFNVCGLATRTHNDNERNPDTAKIPGLWQRYFSEEVAHNTPYKTEDTALYGVYSLYDSDERGVYTLLAGTRINRFVQPALTESNHTDDDAMHCTTVEGGRYLVFTSEGEIPEVIFETWHWIWNFFAEPDCAFKRKFTTDFERMEPGDSNRIQIFIAIE